MASPRIAASLWWRWLVVMTVVVMLFGIGMVVAPGLTRQAFGWLVYASPDRIGAFGADAVAYISLVHAVLGAVLFGWGTAMLLIVLGPLRRGAREGWQMLVVSLVAWFIPDTAFSLWSGFWQNAALNVAVAALFAIPMAATYRAVDAAAA